MIVIALWVPYLATKGIGMRQFMELARGVRIIGQVLAVLIALGRGVEVERVGRGGIDRQASTGA